MCSSTFASRNRRYLSALAVPVLASVLLVGLGLLLLPRPAYANGTVCFAEYTGDTVTDFSSADAQAVRSALAAAAPGSTVKIAGYCAGVSGGQVVNITQTLTLAGGYTTTNWTTYNPAANPTTLDALGGGRVISASVAATLQGFTVTNGVIDGDGGGIYAAGALTLTEMTIYSNTATNFGGGAYFYATATLTGTTFTGNTVTSGNGGGAYFYATATLTGTTFTGNMATQYSGGGASFFGSATLAGTTFTGNTANSSGGGAFFYGSATATLTDTTFTGNTANSSGGGASFGGPATLTGATFTGNTAIYGYGGGAYFDGHSRVVNALFARNSASLNGAALYLFNPGGSGGVAEILHTTIASPTVGAGPAIYVGKSGATVNLTNTIVASYTTGISQTAGAVVNSDYNLFYKAPTTVTIGSHSITGTAPLFVNPAGGDYHLAAGSPAIDRGANAGVLTDLGGVARPRGLGFDMGAFESPYPLVIYHLFLPLIQR